MSNTDRTRKAAWNAINAYVESDGIPDANDVETTITDLIADLMHLADSIDCGGESVANIAYDYYRMELEEKA